MSLAHDAHPSDEEQDDTVEAHYACLERSHVCIAGCSLAALSSPSTTLMARSSSTFACRVVVATRRVGDLAGVSFGVSRPSLFSNGNLIEIKSIGVPVVRP